MDNQEKTLPLEGLPPLPAPRIGRDEMNLCEFPFATLTCRNRGLKTLVFSDTIRGQEGKLIERTWTVTGSDLFGLPTPVDEHVYIALMEATREHDFTSRRVPITRYELVSRLRWPDNGGSYQRLKESLKRLHGVSIYADQAFWNNRTKSYVTIGFGILDGFELHSEPRGRKSEEASLPQSWILWNEVIFQSMQCGNLKHLDTDFYFSLDHYTTQRLYRHLDKKRYDGKRRYATNLSDLAFCHIGIDRPEKPYPSLIKQRLQPAHEELLARHFLREVLYYEGRDGEVVEYHFEPNRKRTLALPAGPSHSPLPPDSWSDEERKLIEELTRMGVTRAVAQKMVREQPSEEVRKQLDYLPYRQAEEPAALLVKAIEQNWAAPPPYQKAQEAEEKKRQQAEATRRQSEAAEAAERERQERQERIEGLKATLSREELEELFDAALQEWAPGTQRWHRDRGLEAPSSQALLDQWIAQKYLGADDHAAPG